MSSRVDIFTTIRIEGAILPADLLQHIADGDKELGGLASDDYHLPGGEKLNEATNSTWNRMRGAWIAFKSAVAKLPEGDMGTTVARERWLLPLFQDLGYGRLVSAKAIEGKGKTYSISHGWEHSPIHFVGCRVGLDAKKAGVAGAARSSPHSLVQEFLNSSDDHLWGFVSNGLKLRILRDNVSLTRQAYVEFDLETMMDGEVYADFVLLWLLCHQSRVEAKRPEECWLERWSKAAQEQGTRALEDLRNGVEQAISALGRGFLAHSANRALRDKLQRGELSAQDFYRQLLRLVYRLLFLFVAEDRDLLVTPNAETAARRRYTQFYSLSRLRRLAERRRGTRHFDLFHGLRLIMQKLGGDTGCPELGLPALGSFLFSKEAISDLNGCELANYDLLEAVRALAFLTDGHNRRPIDYKNLRSEELGSVYESLLELHPTLNVDAATFELTTAGGHERKTTGSYYTPESLVVCLLDSALDPVLDEACRKPKPEAAILQLKICDPACGSGHFLIAAAHRIAKRLAAIRTGDEEPSPEATRKALRDVIGHCVYGVDQNPMAVELCKLALWMEALEPGKPLSFLDHRIQLGNSLLGTTPALLKNGIPDEAFKEIEGDDKEICKEYKKKNKDERKGVRSLFDAAAEPWERLGDLASSLMSLDIIADDTIEGVRRKQEQYEALVKSSGYLYGCLWADSWCAAFVWKKTKDFPYPITEEVFRKMEENPHSIAPWMRDEIQRLARQYQFFHWHLAFPDVFRVPGKDKTPENEQTGWNGGFDAVLGNPPWERVQVEEKQFFAAVRPDIAAARSKDRKKLILALQQEDAKLFGAWREACRLGLGQGHLIKESGNYRFSGSGNLNTFALFAEGSSAHLSAHGRMGIIVPSGLITEASNEDLFRNWMLHRQIIQALDFENSSGLFPEVHRSFRFCLLTLCAKDSGPEKTKFMFFLSDVREANDRANEVLLGQQEISVINPSSQTCPPIRSQREAEFLLGLHRRFCVFAGTPSDGSTQWGIESKQMLNSSHDSGCFIEPTEEILIAVDRYGMSFLDGAPIVRLYDGKMIDQFNHRLASTGHNLGTTYRTTSSEGTSREQYSNPNYIVMTQYWVPLKKVVSLFPDYCRERRWMIAFRAVTASTNWRTVIATIVPICGLLHAAPALYSQRSAQEQAFLIALVNSFALDHCARLKLSGTHFSHFILRQLPVPSPLQIKTSSLVSNGAFTSECIAVRVLELVYTAWDLEPFAKDCGYDGPPFRWDEDRRLLIRCELDAAFFHLYGIVRDDVDYIMETFPIVRRRDEEKFGGYRTKRIILEIYDAMADAIRTGKPYQTRLDPPPADPRCAHPPRERV